MIIADTGALYALVDASDAWHERVVEWWRKNTEPIVVPVVVLPEVTYLLQKRIGTEAELAFVRAVAAGEFTVEPVDDADIDRVAALMEKYEDLALGFVDGSIVAVAERLDATPGHDRADALWHDSAPARARVPACPLTQYHNSRGNRLMTRLVISLALTLAASGPVAAQSFMAEMHRDVNQAQKKMVDLARAMPENTFNWRPSPEARSVGEVFLHVASDNYLIPIFMGMPAPAGTGITSDYATAGAFEKRPLTKAQIVAELEASYGHLHKAMGLTTDQNVGETVTFFGQDWSRMRAMVLTVTHLHEHLGQAIAYARANRVVPPWSQ